MPIQGLQFNIPNSQERHQTYQATGSFVVYNPNDGIAFVATDRTSTPQSFDYKVPSQSGGSFPGPINSYLSIYYLDQSGGGLSGQIHVYASPDKVNIPHFWSIGRALQTAGTTMDITMGTQPQNPPANTARLWADANGDLWVTLASGLTFKLADYNDTLGGVLAGTLPNPTAAAPFRMPGYSQVYGAAAAPTSGAGLEQYSTGAGGYSVLQAFDRGGNAWMPLYLRGSTVYLDPQAGIIVPTTNFSTVVNNDWFRAATDGYGIYNNANGQGVGLSSSLGVYDYASSRRFARIPVPIADMGLNAGDIVNMWSWILAPGGSTTSGTMSPMPGQLGNATMVASGYTGGRFLLLAEINVYNSGAGGGGGQLEWVLNGADVNVKTSFSTPTANVGVPVPMMYAVGSGIYSSLTIAIYWLLVSGGTLQCNTGLYSHVYAFEFKK